MLIVVFLMRLDRGESSEVICIEGWELEKLNEKYGNLLFSC